MVKGKLKVVIDNKAKQQLRNLYDYIKKDSQQNAENVKSKIITSLKELIKNPELHSPDKYRIKNDGSYRAYEIYK